MKLPISKRLCLCAEMVASGVRVADIGCDHGYLAIHLIQTGRAKHVIASDLRPMPLDRARQNAAVFAVAEQMEFRLGSGLDKVAEGEADTLVFAGMGGELIARLLDGCPWIHDARYQLILQPQASGNDLRRWLGEHGFSILQERLVEDGGFLYSAMEARFGDGRALSPGEQYVSPAVRREPKPLLEQYLCRVHKGLIKAVTGLEKSRDYERLAYYRTALSEVERMMSEHGICI